MKAVVAPVTEQKESINSANVRQQKHNSSLTSNFVDNRQQTTALSQLQKIANNRIQNKASFQPSNTPIQKKENKTGLPDNLKSGMENLSGMSLEHVNVHYNSSKPAAVQAHAYAQGSSSISSYSGQSSTQQQQPIQKKENNTGLPDNLKTGMENLSGMSLDDVKVHRNSNKPAQLQAHAYAQGTDIHLGSGQEKHLPHEAWHVVQQKQGRVKPTMQMKGKVNVNDDAGLEKEADVMGAKALEMNKNERNSNETKLSSNTTLQLKANSNTFQRVKSPEGEEGFSLEVYEALYGKKEQSPEGEEGLSLEVYEALYGKEEQSPEGEEGLSLEVYEALYGPIIPPHNLEDVSSLIKSVLPEEYYEVLKEVLKVTSDQLKAIENTDLSSFQKMVNDFKPEGQEQELQQAILQGILEGMQKKMSKAELEKRDVKEAKKAAKKEKQAAKKKEEGSKDVGRLKAVSLKWVGKKVSKKIGIKIKSSGLTAKIIAKAISSFTPPDPNGLIATEISKKIANKELDTKAITGKKISEIVGEEKIKPRQAAIIATIIKGLAAGYQEEPKDDKNDKEKKPRGWLAQKIVLKIARVAGRKTGKTVRNNKKVLDVFG